MAAGQRLEQRLGQGLVMTPQLQQAIKLLQYSNIELSAFVEEELGKNPLLERVEDGPVRAEELMADAPGTPDDAPDGEAEPVADSAALTGSDTLSSEGDAPLDADYANVYDGEQPVGGGSAEWGSGGRRDFADTADFEESLSPPASLREHLDAQLGVDIADPVERMIAANLIGMVDDAGYLDGDPDDITESLGCPAEQVEAVLAKAQRCDPTGVFARSLSECLSLQLAARDRLDATMVALLDNLDLLASRELQRLAERCGVDDEQLVLMVQELRELDPKPGLAFAGETAQTVVADVLVSRRADGGWGVELNAETLPRVLVNNRYYTEVSRTARAKEDSAYLGENLQSANWLVKALDQRANTILKVTGEIVRQQEGFLLHGVRHLRPLTLRDVAEAVEMHESTVSRVTSHKYMVTHRGIYELKYFFTSAIPGRAGGDAVSSEAVRDHIRSLIDQETVDSVLSDDRLVTLLRGNGIDIARRTVAKYREAMKIPSSVQRRRLKRADI
jgi:RNA polymerase sigma-54 factor